MSHITCIVKNPVIQSDQTTNNTMKKLLITLASISLLFPIAFSHRDYCKTNESGDHEIQFNVVSETPSNRAGARHAQSQFCRVLSFWN